MCCTNPSRGIRLITDGMEVTFCLSHGKNNLCVVFKHIILTENHSSNDKIFKPSSQRTSNSACGTPQKLSDILDVLLNLHRTGFYWFLVMKIYTVLFKLMQAQS